VFLEGAIQYSLVVKEEGVVVMVDGSTCEIINIGIIKVTERDETVL